MSDVTQLGLPGSQEIRLVMQQRHPYRLDMRFKTNRDFVVEHERWMAEHKPTAEQELFQKEFMNFWPKS